MFRSERSSQAITKKNSDFLFRIFQMIDWRWSRRPKHVVIFLNAITKVCLAEISRCYFNKPRRPRGGVDAAFYTFLKLCARLGWVVSATARPLNLLGERPGTRCAGEWVWTSAENLASAWTRCRKRPALSESLYRLSYPGPYLTL